MDSWWKLAFEAQTKNLGVLMDPVVGKWVDVVAESAFLTAVFGLSVLYSFLAS